jgi:hypothetical protein
LYVGVQVIVFAVEKGKFGEEGRERVIYRDL